MNEDKEQSVGVCPKCGKTNLAYKDGRVEYTQYLSEWHCPDCGADGKEWYEMIFIGHEIKG